jgi:7,8-dihydropterin-6-yl-methyl-4-(beta-D-ribofuranosyl)aminobenzene 5'-phosphate synthase
MTMKRIISIAFFTLAGVSIIVWLVFVTRQAIANREIEREWKSIPTIIPALAATSHLEIVPLYEEASSGDKFISGHGVSYLIRTDSATILMDVGNNPDGLTVAPFMQNMQALGIAWDEIDRIVITHPHPDHIGGVDAWRNNTVTFGELPGGLGERLLFIPVEMNYSGAIHATIPTLPAPDVATTGVISYPEVFPLSLFEPKGSEQALVVNVSGQGLVVVTGCGHPTIEKLIARAEALYSLPVVGIVGGLHYEGFSSEDVQPHIEFLMSRQLQLVALSPHDSSLEALEAFQSAFAERYHLLRVGETIEFP